MESRIKDFLVLNFNGREYLSTDEAAKYANVTRITILNLQKALDVIQQGNVKFFAIDKLDKYIEYREMTRSRRDYNKKND